ncbi:hypothetical protein RJ639_032784 [Escallonia herrerae]|uniref:Transposase (Putative), gypsy type n=1 Tax=Escallonia herrerae TaxID=1293975 RepID=A0AA88WWG4_9ASTE|nr:hypothetical protein RJ639_032784 [Escallonia herrerae]
MSAGLLLPSMFSKFSFPSSNRDRTSTSIAFVNHCTSNLGNSGKSIRREDDYSARRGDGFAMSSTSSSSSSSSSTSSPENTFASDSESRSSQVGTSTLRSQVGTFTPQASTSFPHRDALWDIKDEAEDKCNEETWFTSEDKRNKMSKQSIVELLEEFPLPPPFTARVPALQEPTNYGTDLETSVYEGQIRLGYRLSMHPYANLFFNYYNMAPAQLMPNGWRKLLGLIYLVRTSGYPTTVHDFMRLYLEASKGKMKEGTGEGSSPLIKRPRAPTPPVPPSCRKRWMIKRGDSGMPSSHVSAQYLAHRVLPVDRVYYYSSQMQDRFNMAMDVACTAETKKRVAVGKADKLDTEVKGLKAENADLLTKLGRLEKRCEKLRVEKAEIGNKAIQAFLDGNAGEEWLRKRTEDGLCIFQEGFQKAKELMMVKYPSLSLDDVVVPTFESLSGETAAPTEAWDIISPGGRSVRSRIAYMS